MALSKEEKLIPFRPMSNNEHSMSQSHSMNEPYLLSLYEDLYINVNVIRPAVGEMSQYKVSYTGQKRFANRLG